ncbi:uncharacterized protein G2W53_014492 [Senna tora]|uniref:Uncharacterized protein n=1 Tax=Senna tora TaxID=362788 RepID=A0A834WTT9_9FABA|nr:uncharacterized protein G2W53_014492 [Senna tora]
MELVIAWKVCKVMSRIIMNRKSRLNLKRIQQAEVKRVVAQSIQTDRFVVCFGIRLQLMLKWDL